MKKMTLDGNAAVAYISYALSEVAVIYPITPASPMAENADLWAANGRKNLFGQVPRVVQMQSEGGAAGALHGALTCGALSVTYTCSQGLLLMLPEMYKIAGELLPAVFHVSARALSTHALSIFGDHQDVMACRQSGFAMLASASVQEAMDTALVSHLAALKASLPFLHFFDGFRTSHEMQKIEGLEEEELRALVDGQALQAFRERALDPSSPIQRGTAQNPDTYFQNREAANARYAALPALVQSVMDGLAAKTGRQYKLFEYHGSPSATHVLVLIGSAGLTAAAVAKQLCEEGKSVGVVRVRLYRPFDGRAFCAALPSTCTRVSVLDRTKEAGALGEPLYLDVCAALQEQGRPQVCVYGGRYGLGGKDFTPAQCLAVFQNGELPVPKNHFTVGIEDDVTHSSLPLPAYTLPFDGALCKFYGLGSDGTVGANKNTVKILGEHTELYPQGYFCYDSRKSGGLTISHLRVGKAPFDAPYLIERAPFIACHDPSYLRRYDIVADLTEGGTLLLNCPWTDLESLEARLPAAVKRRLAERQAALYVLDATSLAKEIGLEGRTSTIMQAAFFYLHQSLLPYAQAKALLLAEIERKYAAKGGGMVEMNALCVEKAEGALKKIDYPSAWKNAREEAEKSAPQADGNEYFREFMRPVLTLHGDELPVSAFSADGSVPTGTAKYEKHGAPPFLPKWVPENCIQCNQCAFVCPHACIRPFLLAKEEAGLATLPATGVQNARFRIQVSPDDCMGCGVCARTCPTKEKALVMTKNGELPTAREDWERCQAAPKASGEFKRSTVKGSQFYPPLFEFSYACSGCGETPYIKVLTQLFGERMLIANATGCSSIYGGSAPACPYTKNERGEGPAWASSLFEDNAEFGYGMRLALEARGASEGKSVWIIGGDGWAYDIGYGGLDHVLASGANVNVLVLDSEVYSNTGGQLSKATPLGATARFAALGKGSPKKELGLMAMSYRSVYVAQVSMGADKAQLLNALTEAEAYEGPSLIIAYSPCIAHGVYLGRCMEEEKLAVESGYWTLYRYNPAAAKPFSLDGKPPTKPLSEFLSGESRFARLKKEHPERAEMLFAQAEKNAAERYAFYQKLANLLE